jgi:hypothetical protein
MTFTADPTKGWLAKGGERRSAASIQPGSGIESGRRRFLNGRNRIFFATGLENRNPLSPH